MVTLGGEHKTLVVGMVKNCTDLEIEKQINRRIVLNRSGTFSIACYTQRLLKY